MKADHHIRLFDLQYMSRTECMQAIDASSHAKLLDPPFGMNIQPLSIKQNHMTKSHLTPLQEKITFFQHTSVFCLL